MLQVVVLEHLLVFDVVEVFVAPPLALDAEFEHLFDGLAMPAEQASVHGHATAQLGLHPPLVYFVQCDASGPMNRIHQPDVLPEDSCHFHNSLLFFRACKVRFFTRFVKINAKKYDDACQKKVI